MSYTLARLPVPRAVFDLIADKLRRAGYDHVFHGDTIDMTHIGLEVSKTAPVTVPSKPPLTTDERTALARYTTLDFAAIDKIDPGEGRQILGLLGSVLLEASAKGSRSCGQPATVEIRPHAGHFEDSTHSCDRHIADLLGHFDDQPEPHHYEVRPLTDEEREGNGQRPAWCCYVEPRRAPDPDGILTTDAPAIGSAP